MAIPQSQLPSTAGAVARAWLGFVVLVGAHFAVRPLFDTRVNVDFLLIGILFASVRVRPGVAALLGLVAGLTIDAFAPAAVGAAALSLVLVAFIASWVKAVFFADHVALTGLFVFVGKVGFDAVYALLSGGFTGLNLVVQLLIWSPISALMTAAVALVLLTAFRPVYRPSST